MSAMVPLSCGYRQRSVCAAYLACLEPVGGDWEVVGAEEQYGSRGDCWADDERLCGAECYERILDVPRESDNVGLCEVVYTPDLLTEKVFLRMFAESFCQRSRECDEDCAPPFSPSPCVFDLEAGRACLQTRATWPCDEDEPGGVALPDACEQACAG